MKNIHLLPTDKPSRLYLEDVKFKLTEYDYPNVDYAQNQHIYITNDEEIKEEDWVFGMDGIFQYKGKVNLPDVELPKKIILTTDLELIADGIQAIGNEFLEWFVKNPSCESVEVKKGFEDGTSYGYNFLDYKIIIPQEEPKQEIELINGFIPTSFFNKQETLEEAAGKLYPLTGEVGIDHRNYLRKEGFINGAKYQAERMYTLEQISKDFIGEEGQSGYFDDWLDYRLDTGNKLSFKEWFEQFKNK
jgi:hypothetical protein